MKKKTGEKVKGKDLPRSVPFTLSEQRMEQFERAFDYDKKDIRMKKKPPCHMSIEELKKMSYKGNQKEVAFDTNRKHYPVHNGCFKYFPKALTYISHVSWKGNEQHNPNSPLHWDRTKSQDDDDARARHILESDDYDTDGLLQEGKTAWRALAVLEKLLEKKNFKI